MTLETVPSLNPVTAATQPYWIAVVVNGVVYDVMNLDGQGAAKFLANPTFVQVGPLETGIGWTYDAETHTFSRPE